MSFRLSLRPLCGRVSVVLALAGSASVFSAAAAYAAQAPVGLGTADSFAVLAGSAVTNTGPTTITGDVGAFPTPSETGFGSVTLHGTNHDGDAVTQQAQNDLTTAYNDAAGRGPATNVPVELGGSTLQGGVYANPTLGLTGTLTLNAQGNPNTEFIFQAGSTLTTASNSNVVLENGAVACNVVWQVGSSATFGTGTQFVGDVLAETSITAQTSATFQGRLLAQNGAVTLDTNTIMRPTCRTVGPTPTPTQSVSPSPTGSPTGGPTPSPTGSTPPTATPTPTGTHGGPAPKPSVSATAHKHHHGPGSSSGTGTHTGAGAGGGAGTGSGTSGNHGQAEVSAAAASSLPFTGFDAEHVVEAAVVLMALGGAMLMLGRTGIRRRRGRHS